MNWYDWVCKWGMGSLNINSNLLRQEWRPTDADRVAAWDLYVELLTRVATRKLENHEGDEATALNSVYSLFATTRGIMTKRGSECSQFAKITLAVLDRKVRPFTSKWHHVHTSCGITTNDRRSAFRDDLSKLQESLRTLAKMLAEMAGAEDLVDLLGEI